MEKGGKLTLDNLKAFKDTSVCSCKPEDKPIFINSDIFSRQSIIKPYESYFKGKGKGNRKGNFHKGGSHHNHGHHGHNRAGGRHSYHDRPPREDNFKRKKVSEQQIEMKTKADKWKQLLVSTDKEDIEKQTKALLNKITLDNYKKLRDPICQILINCTTSEERQKFVKIFFKKATHEDKYCSMYTNLVRYIGEIEFDKSLEETPSAQTPNSKKMKKAKGSQFNKDLVEECKSTLDEFAKELSYENVKEEDKEDFEYRYKKRLFGNLKFIAELYKKKLVGPAVALYVLRKLLGLIDYKQNEFMIEGACTFMSRVGEKLDKKRNLDEPETPRADDGETSPTKVQGKRKENQEMFETIISKMEEFQRDENIESRIRIILQNTLAKRDDDWKENIKDEGPKTKKQLKDELLREMKGEVEAPKATKKKSAVVKKSSQKSGMFGDISMTKMMSANTLISEQTEESDKEQEPVKKEYSPRELEHRDHEAIKDRYIGNFVEYLNTQKIDLTMFDKPENKCSGHKIV